MKYLAYLALAAIAEIVAVILAPVLPLATILTKNGYLPIWLDWFQTPDNSLYGDKGHRERWQGKNEYLQQVAWLLRNRAYGFKWGPLGVDSCIYATKGNPKLKNREDAVAGWMLLSGMGSWYAKAVIPIGFDYCIQLAFGWQLDAPIGERCLFMCSPRITKFYGSKND